MYLLRIRLDNGMDFNILNSNPAMRPVNGERERASERVIVYDVTLPPYIKMAQKDTLSVDSYHSRDIEEGLPSFLENLNMQACEELDLNNYGEQDACSALSAEYISYSTAFKCQVYIKIVLQLKTRASHSYVLT